MIAAETPNLWEIRSKTDHATAIGIIVIALIHTARLVNVDANLNETQIGEIANDVLEEYGYLKVEEVKYVLKTAVKTQKIYGRLDYNIVMNWFKEYDVERTTLCADISDNESKQQREIESRPGEGAMTYQQYVDKLKKEAENGSEDAKRRLALIIDKTQHQMPGMSIGDRHSREVGFKQWFYNEYLKNKGKR